VAAPPTAPPAPPDETDAGGRGWGLGRVLGVAVALALAVFWIWIFSGAPRKQNPDYLEDRAWVERTEATCATTVARIDELPAASESEDHVERAAVVARANDELDRMLDRIAADPPKPAADREVVEPWLADWRTYLGDRRDYAERLREDPDARLLVDEKFGDQIETVITTFTEVNRMISCAPPGDVA
jgi:hypothetical protein